MFRNIRTKIFEYSNNIWLWKLAQIEYKYQYLEENIRIFEYIRIFVRTLVWHTTLWLWILFFKFTKYRISWIVIKSMIFQFVIDSSFLNRVPKIFGQRCCHINNGNVFDLNTKSEMIGLPLSRKSQIQITYRCVKKMTIFCVWGQHLEC